MMLRRVGPGYAACGEVCTDAHLENSQEGAQRRSEDGGRAPTNRTCKESLHTCRRCSVMEDGRYAFY